MSAWNNSRGFLQNLIENGLIPCGNFHPSIASISSSSTQQQAHDVKPKLTARIRPMTRENLELGSGRIEQRNNDEYCRTAEERTGEQFAELRVRKRSFSDVGNSQGKLCNSDLDVKHELKKPCLESRGSTVAVETITTETAQDSEKDTGSPSSSLSRSLLSATECHLATLQDEDGDTPLHLAIVQSNISLVDYLIGLMSCLTLDIYNNLRQTPLHLAILTNQPAIVQRLVSARVNVNLPDRNGQTAAHLSCKQQDTICLQELMRATKPVLNLETQNFQGLAPLHEAVFARNFQAVQLLAKYGAQIDVQDATSGRTPLHHAVEKEDLQMIEVLINLGASINAMTFSGNTPLHTASGRDMTNIVKLLLSSGADVTVHNGQYDSAVTIAKSKEMAKALKSVNGAGKGRGKKKKGSKDSKP